MVGKTPSKKGKDVSYHGKFLQEGVLSHNHKNSNYFF